MTDALLLANAVSTWFMVGVIWLVQLVIYPSFRAIDPGRFREAMVEHQSRIGSVVILPMLVELSTSIAILGLHSASPLSWLGCVCVGVWGFSTVLVQVPLHRRLGVDGPNAEEVNDLVKWNWLRTIAWTAHGILCAATLVS